MGTGSGGNGLKKLRLSRIGRVIQIDKPRLGRGHVQTVSLRVIEHFQRHPLFPCAEVIDLIEGKRLGLRIPDPGPQGRFEHIGNVHDRRICLRSKHDFDRGGIGGRRFR